MIVQHIKDLPDGSAIFEFEITQEERDAFIKIGILKVLEQAVNQQVERDNNGNREPVVDA
jgi:hypothetical protein